MKKWNFIYRKNTRNNRGDQIGVTLINGYLGINIPFIFDIGQYYRHRIIWISLH